MAQSQQGSGGEPGQGKPASVPGNGKGATDRVQGVAEESRSFLETGADVATRALDRGLEATREAAGAGLEANEELADTNRWMAQRTSEFWLASMGPLLSLQAEGLKLFEELCRQAPSLLELPSMFAARPFGRLPLASWFGLPAAELKETDDLYTLRVELPGLAVEDLNLTIRGDTLVVSAEKCEDQAGGGAIPWISERRFGRIDRTFVLPRDVDRGRITARLQKGLLDVTLPKAVEASQTAAMRVSISA